MAFDQSTRNRLQKFVSDARGLLSEEFTRQLQNDYGLDPHSGTVTPLENLGHLDDSRRETARILRETLAHYLASSPSGGNKEALDRIVREQAFTVLNRLAALRMAESRGILIESVGNGYQSKGFQLYERLAGPGLGETGETYRCYLFSIFDEFSLDLKVLFDRFSPQGRLFPRETALLELLGLLNDQELAHLWAEDETIGWVYQYFNSKEERKKMRDESAAPRNSRELAVRNQFFTPRYVVEFLTDNTLGRIWYEMTQGATGLKESCRYLVRRPTEIFLKAGEKAPDQPGGDENLSQEELLKQPVHIQFRPLKDPRTLRMLDPACGSMHFGLYAFDLYEQIYDEAWDLEVRLGAGAFVRENGLKPLSESYHDKESFLQDVPRLIIEHNIHGIDIDPRASQIAGLSLWLRAQRSWHNHGVKPAARPRITRSNIVCAEPMPGEKELLREFTSSLEVPALGYLVEQVFDKMQLAGEAGSLLKIEEEIRDIIAEAKNQWKAGPKLTQMGLFGEAPAKPEQVELPLDFTGVTDERFWEGAEEKLYQSLLDYAEVAVDNGYQRRLFAEDASRGFAFIDLCRKNFDVVLMNPPFGAAINTVSELLKSDYESAKSDLYAAFVYRATRKLDVGGRVGVISARTGFFLQSLRDWRCALSTGTYQPVMFADLGGGVLDAAMVETAAYIISSNKSAEMVCINATSSDEKQNIIIHAIRKLVECEIQPNVFIKKPSFFERLPNNVWAYWISNRVISLFDSHPSIDPDVARVCVGVQTDDDFRFVRTWWEVPQNSLGSSKEDSENGKGWIAFLKGGDSTPFFSNIPCVLNWKNDGNEQKEFISIVLNGGHWSRHAFNSEIYFKEGISWALRTNYFSPHFVPKGCIPSVSRYLAVAENIHPMAVLSLLNSSVYDYLVKINMEKWLQPKFIVSCVKRLPFPFDKTEINNDTIVCDTNNLLNMLIDFARFDQISRYALPFYESSNKSLSDIRNSLINKAKSNNDLVSNLITSSTIKLYNKFRISEYDLYKPPVAGLDDDFDDPDNFDQSSDRDNLRVDVENNLLLYAIGSAFGRWDIRFATGEKSVLNPSDPFSSLPTCPPGMLQNPEGLPAKPQEIPENYPLRISWLGIMVDEEGHKEDIATRVREVIEVIWKDKAGNIEHEACEMLGVRSLRDYFTKPSGFFADHLKRYSKSRRQAPIYWPLSTPSGSYTLWLYYHRLNDQTLYTCVNDFVEPKLTDVAADLASLRQKGSGRSRDDEKRLEKLQDLEIELQEFRDELLRLARLPWKPNLNDGVQITAAPLWKLFQLPKWKKTLKETWEKLEKGEYDWAHLAYSIWPDRVKKKCVTDKSLAIAHDLEDLYVEPPASAKKKRGKKAAVVEEEEE